MPAARVAESVVGNTLTVTWPAPENVNFLMSYRVSYTTTSRLTPSGRRRRQTSAPMTLPDIPVTGMRSATLPFQAFSNYSVDVLAVYNPPPSGDEVTVILLPTTNFPTPERRKKPHIISGVRNHMHRLTLHGPQQTVSDTQKLCMYLNLHMQHQAHQM